MAEQHTSPGTLEPVEALRLENQRLKLLTEADPPAEILAVSDLHLGRGREPNTRRFFCTENFVSDQAFARFLRALEPGEGKLLILNGDTFDFIRICNCPGSPEEFAKWGSLLDRLGVAKSSRQLQDAISKNEKRYGLQTDDYKCVWKLLQIFEGHQEFFHALADWVERGGSLLMVKGNHDLDLYWPLVRRAFCAFLEDKGASRDAIARRVFYCDSSIHIRNVYLEHGQVYDPQQRIKDGPVLSSDPSQLNLPLASFIARYLINQLEKLEPFIGSIRPTERILWILLRSHPVAGLAVLGRSLRFIRRAAQTSHVRDYFWFVIYFATVALPLVTCALLAVIIFYAPARKLITGGGQKWTFIWGLVGLLAPYIAAALREFSLWLKNRRRLPIGEDQLAQGVYQTIRNLPFPPARKIFAVMGHTHDQDVQCLPDINGAKVLYLNTGSWIPVWPDDRPDLAGQVFYPFVHFRLHDGEYHHCYSEWRDDRGHPAEAYILAPSSKK
jgi:UDP-2,3-diacylglucosamine pyrophosphatase LpxH